MERIPLGVARKSISFSFPAVATLEKILLNLDNLCLAYPRLLYFATLVAFQEAVATQVVALVLALSLRNSDSIGITFAEQFLTI